MAVTPKIVKSAPVVSLSAVESLVAFVLTLLVTHQVIGDADVTATTQVIAPFVASALPVVFGLVKWALVSPYEKVKGWATRDGVLSDADFGRLESLVASRIDEALAQLQQTGSGAGDPTAVPGVAARNNPVAVS